MSAAYPDESAVTLPLSFFREMLPAIDSLAELRLTLYLYQRVATGDSLVAEAEILADVGLRRGLLPVGSARDAREPLTLGLEACVRRGTALLVEGVGATAGRWYAINTPATKQLLDDLAAGRAEVADLDSAWQSVRLVTPATNIFRLYEQHVAPLTPTVAEQLTEAAETYPADWITDAFSEAVARERRSWSYIRHLLERWSSGGRNNGADRRTTAQPLDTDKYTKGKYAAFFRRGADDLP